MVAINPHLALEKHSTKTSETSNKYLSNEEAFNKAATTSVQYYKSSENMTVVICLEQIVSNPRALFAFTCLQVDFLPLSEVASAIWFQM